MKDVRIDTENSDLKHPKVVNPVKESAKSLSKNQSLNKINLVYGSEPEKDLKSGTSRLPQI